MRTIFHKGFLLLLILFLSWRFGMAQTCVLVVDSSFEQASLSNYVSYTSVKNFKCIDCALDSIEKSTSSKHCEEEMSPGFSEDIFLISFEIENLNNSNNDYYLELNNPHIDSIVLFEFIGSNDVLEIGVAGDRMLFNERPIENRRFIFPIELKKGEVKKFLLIVNKRNASVSFPTYLWSKEEFKKLEKRNGLFYLLYFGGVIFIFLFSMVIGLMMRNVRMISYGLYAGSMGLYLFIALGFGFQYLYPNSITLNNTLRTQILVISLMTFVLFSSLFMNLHKEHKRQHKVLMIIFFFLVALSLGSFVFESFFFQHIIFFLNVIYILLVLSLPIFLYSAYISYKKNPTLVISYLIALSALFTGAIINTLVEYGWINEDNIPFNTVLLGSIVELFVFSLTFITEIKTINDKKNSLLREQAKQQKELVSAYVRGIEEEGGRISKELHDNIGSRLAILKNQIDYLDIDRKKIKDQVVDIFSDVRQISDELSPSKIQILGIVPSIEELFSQLIDGTDIKVNFYADEIPDLNNDNAIQIYRVIQEIIQNIVKHSDATEVDCQILKGETNDEGALIMIDDNGKGFNTSDIDKNMGFGLKNMQFRIESVGGKIEISSNEGRGTHIMIWCVRG